MDETINWYRAEIKNNELFLWDSIYEESKLNIDTKTELDPKDKLAALNPKFVDGLKAMYKPKIVSLANKSLIYFIDYKNQVVLQLDITANNVEALTEDKYRLILKIINENRKDLN